MGYKIQTIKIDVKIDELHDVNVSEIENFIRKQKYTVEVSGGLVNSNFKRLK